MFKTTRENTKRIFSAVGEILGETKTGQKISNLASKTGEKIKSAGHTVTHTSIADIGDKVSNTQPVRVYRAVKQGLAAARAIKQAQDTTPSA